LAGSPYETAGVNGRKPEAVPQNIRLKVMQQGQFVNHCDFRIKIYAIDYYQIVAQIKIQTKACQQYKSMI